MNGLGPAPVAILGDIIGGVARGHRWLANIASFHILPGLLIHPFEPYRRVIDRVASGYTRAVGVPHGEHELTIRALANACGVFERPLWLSSRCVDNKIEFYLCRINRKLNAT